MNPKTLLYKGHITTNRSLVKGGYGMKSPRLWDAYAQNLVTAIFRSPLGST